MTERMGKGSRERTGREEEKGNEKEVEGRMMGKRCKKAGESKRRNKDMQNGLTGGCRRALGERRRKEDWGRG